jgi:hypothetical protein
VSGGTTTTEYGFGIQLMNDADHNTVENCTITMTNVSTSSNYAGIVINGSATSPTAVGTSNCDSNLIVGNTIDGGYAGITLVGNGSTSEIYGNKVLNNTIKDFYTYGIYINGNVGSIIANNNISRPVRSAVSNFMPYTLLVLVEMYGLMPMLFTILLVGTPQVQVVHTV